MMFEALNTWIDQCPISDSIREREDMVDVDRRSLRPCGTSEADAEEGLMREEISFGEDDERWCSDWRSLGTGREYGWYR